MTVTETRGSTRSGTGHRRESGRARTCEGAPRSSRILFSEFSLIQIILLIILNYIINLNLKMHYSRTAAGGGGGGDHTIQQ
jgi:hypothetical protein